MPYGPLVEAIRPRLERERAPDDFLEDTWLSELSRLLPELKERYPDLPSPTSSGEGETAKGTLFEAIAKMVGGLASGAPVVLFLDDLHWADAATLEVLDYAGRRWAEQGAPVLVLIAARPEEPEGSSGFERWLSSWSRRLPVRSLELGPLGDEDVEGLLRRLAKADSKAIGAPEEPEEEPGGSNGAEPELIKRFGERLAAESGGQPFYLVETLKALLEEEKLVIRSRADGEPVVEAGGREEEEPLLYPSATYYFSHEKIRQVAYTEGGRARRWVLHRRAFAVLEEEGGAPAAQLARHALAGGLAEQAFGYLVAAGDAAVEVFAARDAIEHYERARSLLAKEEVRTDGGQLVEASIPELEHLYTQLGRAYELTNERGKARATYEALLDLGRELGEARLEVVSLNHLAVPTFHQPEPDLPRGRTVLEEARRVAEEADLKEALVETECNLADVMTL